MPYSYRAYGLTIGATDPIAHLATATLEGAPDVAVRFLPGDDRRFPNRGDDAERMVIHESSHISVTRDGDRIELDVRRPDGANFAFLVEPTSVDVLVPSGISSTDPTSFLIGTVLAMVCRLRRQSCLHASVLAVDDRAFALVGRKGAGKSTTAAALLRLGARLVSDDVGVLSISDDVAMVAAGYPSIRLTEPTMRHFGFDRADAPVVLDGGDKRYVPAATFEAAPPFVDEAVRLNRIYLLEERDPSNAGSAIVAMSPSEALRHANAHAHVGYVRDAEMSSIDFQTFAGFARRGAVVRTVRPDGLDAIEPFARRILDDVVAAPR